MTSGGAVLAEIVATIAVSGIVSGTHLLSETSGPLAMPGR